MEFLWSPWRNHYVTAGQVKPSSDCVFCYLGAPHPPDVDDEHYLLLRGQHNFLILNLYPYTTAHLLIVPFVHLGTLPDVAKAVTDEMMDLAKAAQNAIGLEYNPDGYNLGMNLGKAAGAGIADHVHLHLLPRWSGDANFMTTVGETRVLPEALSHTYQKLKKHFS